jgi:flagellar biogenesis protein FliO
MLFATAPLGAEELYPPRPLTAPPLPPPQSNRTALDMLGNTLRSPNPQPTQPVQMVRRESLASPQTPPQLPPPNTHPNTVSQAAFSTYRLSQPESDPSERVFNENSYNENFYNEERPTDSFSQFGDYDSWDTREPAPGDSTSKNDPLGKLISRKNTGDATDGKNGKTGGWGNKLARPELSSQLAPLISVGGSLLIVIAAFFLLAMLLRKVSPKGNQPLPKEAFECLGRYYLSQKHPLHVLRLGNRIVLVSVMPDGVSTLVEITDPDEVVAFLGLCRRTDSHSATEMFRNTVAKMSDDEWSRPSQRPVVTSRRKEPAAASLNLYSDPDESLASILARGRR